ncbi:MAG: uncharacterized protein QOI34_1244 [Verrucomicrobiota bacterium]|jgi:hypothetical protein
MVGAADVAPSEASIKQLLEIAQAHKLIDTVMTQMDAVTKNALQQVTQGQTVSPQVQKDIERRQGELMKIVKEEMAWDKLEPLYVRVYRQTFNQGEIDGMIAFYKTPTGQALLNKMPLVMQNTMTEMQQRMGPMMQRIQQMQKEVATEIKAEKEKKSG